MKIIKFFFATARKGKLAEFVLGCMVILFLAPFLLLFTIMLIFIKVLNFIVRIVEMFCVKFKL